MGKAMYLKDNIKIFSRSAFIFSIFISRIAVHSGYLGFSSIYVTSTAIFLFLCIALLLFNNNILKWIAFSYILISVFYFIAQASALYLVGERVATSSWISFTFLAIALVPLILMPVRQKS